MKRSEMIEKLGEYMYEIATGETTFRKLADKIITFLEDKGMQPPYDGMGIVEESCNWDEES